MAKFIWIKGKLPTNLEIKQVYGVVFTDNGNILLRMDDDKYKLTGGKPELYDNNLKDTLKREYLEELNVEIKDIHYLGYLLVEENTGEKYAQVRMIARIKNIGNIMPDKDNGKIYKRFMANIKNVKNYLNYSDLAGNQMIDGAIEMAKEKYIINFNSEEYFI